MILPLYFYVILRCKSSEWLESSMQSDLVCDLQYLAVHDFAFFKYRNYSNKRRSVY